MGVVKRFNDGVVQVRPTMRGLLDRLGQRGVDTGYVLVT
jgi:hypothetical protein